MSVFKLDPRHEQDSLLIAELELSQLRLFNRQELLWLLLIPRVADITEFYELTESQQQQLTREINQVSRLLKTHFTCDKLNIAMLGNIVPQLHVHVIARNKDDPFWPKPAFGLVTQTYTPEAGTALVERVRALL